MQKSNGGIQSGVVRLCGVSVSPLRPSIRRKPGTYYIHTSKPYITTCVSSIKYADLATQHSAAVLSCSEIGGNSHLNTCQHIFNSEETTGQSILWRTLYIFPFLFMIIMSSVLIHSWVFLSDKSQIVNMPSLRKNINTVCTYGFSVSANW